MSSVSSASAASTDLYHFERLSAARLDELTALEQVAHPHPWSRRHFADALDAANEIQLLCRDHGVVGYFVAMKGVDEVHLLNLAVAPSQRGQGLGQLLLQA